MDGAVLVRTHKQAFARRYECFPACSSCCSNVSARNQEVIDEIPEREALSKPAAAGR